MPSSARHAIIVYEPEQAAVAAAYLERTKESYEVIALNYWAGRILKEKGIDSRPLGDFAPHEDEMEKLFETAETFTREWYRLPELSFLEYHGIRIGEAVEPAVDNYVHRVLYFWHIVEKILAAYPGLEEIVIPHTSARIPITAGSLDLFEIRAIVDVVRLLAGRRHCKVTEWGDPPLHTGSLLEPRTTWRNKALTLLNWAVVHTTKSRPIKIFASEYWSHIAPVIEEMKDAELVLMDRSEIQNIPWWQIFARRIRFIHPSDVLTDAMRKHASDVAAQFRAEWPKAGPAIQELLRRLSPDDDRWPILSEGLGYVACTYAERVVADAEGIEYIMRREHTNRVVLRASHSGRQHHFFTTTCIAYALGIPSVEIQHAGATMDPRTVHFRITTSYLAAYGTLVRDIYVREGYEPERIRPVGTPRFDRYLQVPRLSEMEREQGLRALGLVASRSVMLAAVPAEGTGVTLSPKRFSSEDVAAFFRTFRDLKTALPDLQIIFKFRPGSCADYYKDYIAELFPEGGVVATDGDLFALVQLSDVASSGNSTALYEIMIAGKPLVLFPWKRRETHYTRVYKQAGAITYLSEDKKLLDIVKSLLADPGYRSELIEKQREFLCAHYSFDGMAARRTAELLRESLKIFPKK